uniref:Uncharacterized protein n=1 Tax=Arundo donax TaxID=35708 RepID=A0A0A9AYU1_ARUDO
MSNWVSLLFLSSKYMTKHADIIQKFGQKYGIHINDALR